LTGFEAKIAAALILLIFQAASSQYPSEDVLKDPVALLQARLDRGELKLTFDARHGYLASVLSHLKIPVSSQALVFSKTSLQTEYISPSTPRALYFNDDVYVGWVPEAPMLEIASVDPQYGTIFYVMSQSKDDAPAFKRLGPPCTSCHGPARDAVPSPLLLMMSTELAPTGEPISDFKLITDRMPFAERWGGWFVNASRASAAHRGNKIIVNGVERLLIDPSTSARPFNTTRYPSPSSDIVSLMLLSHQVEVHNRINEATRELRDLPAAPQARIAEAAEPLVRSLLFSGAVPFPEPIRGSSEFAKEFSSNGRRDSRGRSLKDLDLDRRLMRYPLSYLIYSESFDRMPEAARGYVYRRLWEVFVGKDRSQDFAHLSDADRTALLEIVSETRPEFQALRKTLVP
jgi:hypothetical protein